MSKSKSEILNFLKLCSYPFKTLTMFLQEQHRLLRALINYHGCRGTRRSEGKAPLSESVSPGPESEQESVPAVFSGCARLCRKLTLSLVRPQ